jgi:hypothetical protein
MGLGMAPLEATSCTQIQHLSFCDYTSDEISQVHQHEQTDLNKATERSQIQRLHKGYMTPFEQTPKCTVSVQQTNRRWI